MIKLMLIDDHRIMRIGLKSILRFSADIKIVAEAESGKQALDLFGNVLPDVTLLDIRMPVMNGLETLKALLKKFPTAKIIMLTTSDMEEDIYNSMQQGAKGYLLKDAAPKEIIDAIRQVFNGDCVVPEHILNVIACRSQQDDLSPRQLEVLGLLVKGLTNKEIGIALGISYTSVKTHLEAIYKRLNVANRQEACSTAIQRGIVKTENA
jgi:two-component system NarL family response regulator